MKTSQKIPRDEIQTYDTQTVLDMLECVKPDTWLAHVLRDEMRWRGMNHRGEWVGFARANELWR